MDQRTAARAAAVALAVAAAAGLALGWLGKGRPRRPGGGSRTQEETWTCACGQAYRVAGEGRHKVFWPAGASEGDPVMGTTCVQCDRPLPV